MARLEHPHIVPLYDYWREPGGAYLVFRLLLGGTAFAAMVNDGPFSVARVSRLVEEVGSALLAAHTAGVVHCDIKPSNVLFDETGNAYLSDFGIAVTSTMLGQAGERTRAYAAPELVDRCGDTVRSDIFSFGCMLWELLAGRSPLSVVQPAGRWRLPSLAGTLSEPCEALDAVLARATSSDPEVRFESMAELIVAWRDAVGRPEGVLSPMFPSLSSSPDSPRRRAARALSATVSASVNPYKGLRAFTEGDASDFFGRDDVAALLHQTVMARGFVVVVGPSGSGKSSLVHAGLVPLLRNDGARVATMVPGDRPTVALRQALRQVAATDSDSGDPIEWLKEAVAVGSGPTGARRRSIRGVLDAGRRGRAGAVLGRRRGCRQLRGSLCHDRACRSLRPAVAARVDRPDGRRRKLRSLAADSPGPRRSRRPARRTARCRLRRRCRHSHRRRGQCPPRRTAVAAVRDGGAVRAPCRQRHHVDGASTSWAASAARSDVEPRRSTPRSTTTCEHKHVNCSAGWSPPARAPPTPAGEPGSVNCPSPIAIVADRFVQARLLVADRDLATREPVIEVAHESLLSNWPRLREWLDADRRWLAQLQHLATATRTWDEGGRPDGELYRGSRLEAVLEALPDHESTTQQRRARFRRRQSNGARCRAGTRATQRASAPTTSRRDCLPARPRPHRRWHRVYAAPAGPRLRGRRAGRTGQCAARSTGRPIALSSGDAARHSGLAGPRGLSNQRHTTNSLGTVLHVHHQHRRTRCARVA